MLPLADWMSLPRWREKPWLVLGKGPSFEKHRSFDLAEFNCLSLNHVVRELPVQVAHFIDLDAVIASAEGVLKNAEWLMLPWRPHVDFRPSPRALDELVEEVPVLKEMNRRGRLVWYYHLFGGMPDLAKSYPKDAAPLIRVDYFSSEAAVNVLAAMGVRGVRLLGIDGGDAYSGRFHDLSTRLANGQASFDRQFVGIHRTARESNMDVGKLEEPIRVFVGCDDSQMIAAKVLEYSIRRFTSRPVQFLPMLDLHEPTPKDPKNRPRTGFSFYRLHIPSLAGYKGRAIYVDADMLVFGDLAEVWDLPMGNCRVHCSRQEAPPDAWKESGWFKAGRQMSVMLLDCARLDWNIEKIVADLDAGRYDYPKLMFDLCVVPHDEIGEAIPAEWNSLEHFESGRTRLLHYTAMEMQPWRHPHNPLGNLWREFFRAAVSEGFISPETVEDAIQRGFVRPELAEDLKLAPSRRPAGSLVVSPLDGAISRQRRADELRLIAAQAENEILRSELQRLRGEIERIRVGLPAPVPAAAADPKRDAVQRENQSLRTELAELRSSRAWRIGRAATKPMRILKGMIGRKAA
ncbi:MAG TPA: glycosyltransferase [Planctomycetia bacterium]|nr:glycosyltransferase [Planctomycetia bacterium]